MVEKRPPPPRSPKHRLYLDESGDHSFSDLTSPGRRYLALLGVWFKVPDDYVGFADGLEKLKRDFFGHNPDSPVTLHRSDIINKRGPFRALIDPSTCLRFDTALARLVENAQFTMACVILDKQRLQTQYTCPFHPYHYSLQCLLERYCKWMAERGTEGDIWAEARGGYEDRQLSEVYRAVRTNGVRYLSKSIAQRVLTSNELKFRPKTANIAGLQLADTLAHPVKHAALVERGLLPQPPTPTFGQEIAKLVYPKFRRGFRGQVDGYGRVWL